MQDKYGVELSVGDEVVTNSYNVFTRRSTFEKGVITEIYQVHPENDPDDLLDLCEIKLVTDRVIDGLQTNGIIKIG